MEKIAVVNLIIYAILSIGEIICAQIFVGNGSGSSKSYSGIVFMFFSMIGIGLQVLVNIISNHANVMIYFFPMFAMMKFR